MAETLNETQALDRILDKEQPLRMDAYYYGFEPTGVREIDVILSAVANAGKGYHHTRGWTDEDMGDQPPFRGKSYVDWIQNAANDAAAAWKARESSDGR